jgi:excisionase family DNA binding protein
LARAASRLDDRLEETGERLMAGAAPTWAVGGRLRANVGGSDASTFREVPMSDVEIQVQEVRPLFTVKSLAAYLECSVRQVRVLLDDGEIRHFKVGRQIRVRPEVVEEYLRRCEGEA